MNAKDTLPDTWSATRKHAGPSDTMHVAPGSWWRLTGRLERLDRRDEVDVPDHGLVFLVSDIRIIDGEIHTVILHEHPLLGHGTFKVLLGDLLREFIHEPAGAELREIELSGVMDEIHAITRDMSQPPDDATLLAELPTPDAAEPAADRNAKTAMVPKVLLPGGDVDAAQRKIETALAVMEARKAWVEKRTGEMQDRMNLVARYQTEKVAVGMAGIAEQRKWAENMLENVQTMRLWLGEDQVFETLVKGQGADRDEPLHFMQRMLYLDEEIYTHDRIDGLTGDDLKDLPRILAENPALVHRMMPYPRSVVIAKARRNTRPLVTADGAIDVMQMVHAIESDNQVLILIRNGEQVHMVATDEITSRAKRLFPSKAEIDAIFTEKSFRSEARMITPHDIEYSDKRADHDSRALFYKRVLLILWGLAEREGILGDFIGKGENWLEETVHSASFRFVHDEENVIDDGRPSVRTFLQENRQTVRPGSRVMADWSRLVDEDTAPQIHDLAPSRGRGYRTVDLSEDFGTCLVSSRGRELIVKCPVSKYSYSSGSTRSYKTPVRVSWPHRSDGKTTAYVPNGFLCLDGLRSEDLRYYFESRIHREHYLEYLHLFDRAMKLLASEETVCGVVETLLVARGNSLDAARAAITLWRGARKWDLPDPERDLKKLTMLCARIAEGYDPAGGDALYADLTAAGTIEVATRHDVNVFGRDVPFARIETLMRGRDGAWHGKSERFGAIEEHAGPGKLRLHSAIPQSLLDEIAGLPGILTDLDAVRAIAGDLEDRSGLEMIQALVKGDDSIDPVEILDHCKAWAHAQTGKTVCLPFYTSVIGYVLDETGGNPSIGKIELYVDPVLQCLALGHGDAVAAMARRLYAKPEAGLSSLRGHLSRIEERGGKPFGLRVTRVKTAAEIVRDPARAGCHADMSHAGLVITRAGAPQPDMQFPGSLRELLAGSAGRPLFHSSKKTEEEKLALMDRLSFQFIEGGETLLEDMTGFHARRVSLEEGGIAHEPDP